MPQSNDRLRGPALRGIDGLHRQQWGVTDDKDEFTHAWNQGLHIVVLSDRCLFFETSHCVCGGLRLPCGISPLANLPKAGFHRVNLRPSAVNLIFVLLYALCLMTT